MWGKATFACPAVPAPRPVVQVQREVFFNFSFGRQHRPTAHLGLPHLFFSDSPRDVGQHGFFVISNFTRGCTIIDLHCAHLRFQSC